MKIETNSNRIQEIIDRGTAVEFFPSKTEVLERLSSGERMRMYIGFDPTFTALHLGHAKNIMFAEELRQLGHEIIILFGDFTAMIGDPSGKASARKALTREDIEKNISDWKRQVSPLINLNDKNNPAKIMYNSEWLSKLSFGDVVDLASNFTVQQMLERDMFAKRLKENTPIHVHEFMYPLMQGYDSVAMDVDGEICGTDQIFNALAGRTLQKRLKDKEKIVIALNLIANPKTGELMSKSNGTGVFINGTANELFGSIMALPDPMIEPLFVNCTRIPISEKENIMSMGPRNAKAHIAKDIVARLHSIESAQLAEKAFEETFAKGGVPDDIKEVNFGTDDVISEILVKAGIVPSKTEWRRLVTDGAIRDDNDEKISDPLWKPVSDTILKIGKRRFVKIVIK
jgi:tyrosyl-tRNA synthetase